MRTLTRWNRRSRVDKRKQYQEFIIYCCSVAEHINPSADGFKTLLQLYPLKWMETFFKFSMFLLLTVGLVNLWALSWEKWKHSTAMIGILLFFFEKLLMEKNTYIIFVLFQSSMQFVCPSLCSIPHCRIFSKSACFQKLPYKFSQYATGGMNSKHAEGVGSLEGRHPDWQTPASSYVIVASGIETTTPGGLEQDRTRRWWYSWRFMTRKSKACIRWCIDADVMV